MHHASVSVRLAASLAAAAAVFLPGPARAWGDEGHELVALVAMHYLEPSVRHKVFAMLAADPDNLTPHDVASESVWADRFRDSSPAHHDQTGQWHFVDIDLQAKDIDAACFHHPPVPPATPASGGPAHNCIADKIDQFTAELRSPTTPAGERLLALKFLLHFVGDLHQPLHASDDHDAGGNGKKVKTPAGKPLTLHKYWDTELVRKLGPNAQDVAAELIGRISEQDRQAWVKGSPADWATQSFGVASGLAYGKLPKAKQGVYLLSADYEAKAVDAVVVQLEKGGTRLAEVLNKALSD